MYHETRKYKNRFLHEFSKFKFSWKSFSTYRERERERFTMKFPLLECRSIRERELGSFAKIERRFQELVNNNPRRNYLFSPFADSKSVLVLRDHADNESPPHVELQQLTNIYLSTGLCKRCAARITRHRAILLFSPSSSFLLTFRPPITRDRLLLFFLSCLYTTLCPSLRILLSC